MGGVKNIDAFIKQVKDQELQRSVLMGFGHRVYKNYDPRAKLMQETYPRGSSNELGLQGR